MPIQTELKRIWQFDPDKADQLPRGRHSLTRDEVLASQLGRIYHAVLVASALKGRVHSVVADVTDGAGVSRKTFYEHFVSFDDCFDAAYKAACDVLLNATIAAALAAKDSSPEGRFHAGIKANLSVVASDPLVARAVLLEAAAGGPTALALTRQEMQRLSRLLAAAFDQIKGRRPRTSARSAAFAIAAVGTINTTIINHLIAGEADRLPSRSRQVSAVALAVMEAGQR